MAAPKFDIVPDTPDEPEQNNSVAAELLALSLKALSQRAMVALESLFTLITVGLVFWVWVSIPEPTTHQIVSMSIFATFVLAANVIVRKVR